MKIKTTSLKAILLFVFFVLFRFSLFSQNLGINTDGSTPEAGVTVDVKGNNAKAAATATQTVFQIKSNDATDQLKLRLILGNDATATARYGAIDVADFAGPTYRALALQPLGGNVGIGTTSPRNKLTIISGANDLSSNGALQLYASDKVTNGGYLLLNKNSGSGTYATIQSGDDVGFTPLAINPSGGNVGILTSLPHLCANTQKSNPNLQTFCAHTDYYERKST